MRPDNVLCQGQVFVRHCLYTMVNTLYLFQAVYTPRYKGCMLIIAIHMSSYIAIVATRWV